MAARRYDRDAGRPHPVLDLPFQTGGIGIERRRAPLERVYE